jgi:hypothetical protein
MTNEREKSDRPVVPMKPANDTKDFWSFVEELAEGRGLAKENGRDQDDREEHGSPPLRPIKRHSRKRILCQSRKGLTRLEEAAPKSPFLTLIPSTDPTLCGPSCSPIFSCKLDRCVIQFASRFGVKRLPDEMGFLCQSFTGRGRNQPGSQRCSLAPLSRILRPHRPHLIPFNSFRPSTTATLPTAPPTRSTTAGWWWAPPLQRMAREDPVPPDGSLATQRQSNSTDYPLSLPKTSARPIR